MRLNAKRVGRLYWWVDGYRVYDTLADRWETKPKVMKVIDWAFDVHDRRFFTPVARYVLPRICKHEPVMDHCCMPKHDLCKGCGTRMPGQAER